ncbi:hypothetical protein EUX98_g1010 [Antrodiella citrinella]|uniref:Uncharacterized protein n=1 Tax=Antrodiella citrinella TaxID=2447956 RepID=A0A4S4N2M4_9APHY|nr:hypothetical protein EUX98_g1010 [Antrodiella citrinella]
MYASELSISSQRYTSCTEIVTILLNEMYHKDPHVVDESLEILSSVDTLRSAYSGPDLEDRQCFHIVQEWDTIEDHHAFMSNKATYAALYAAVNRYMTELSMVHVYFVQDPRPAFLAPVTEIIDWTIRPGGLGGEDNFDEPKVVRQLVQRLVEALNASQGALSSGTTQAAYGTCVEDQSVVVACGWDSLEARERMKTDSGEVNAIWMSLQKVGKKHSSLIEASSHSAALMELLEVNPECTRTFIEYIVNRVIETARLALDKDASTSRGRSSSRQGGPENLTKFVLRALYMSDTQVPVLLVALVYIERAKPYLHISQEWWAHERVFLGALICAHKYVNDVTIKNPHWSICSGIFSSRDVGRVEREFLQVLDYKLGITESDILVHYAPIMALTAPERSHSARAQTPICPEAPISHWDAETDSSDDDDGSSSASSCASSSSPNTPADVQMEASNSYVNIPSHPHLPLPCCPPEADPREPAASRRKTYHPLSAALKLLHAFPMHHAPSHRVELPVNASAAPPTAVCLATPLSPMALESSPALESHHDILVTARFERAFC